jgi:hypothetical protein
MDGNIRPRLVGRASGTSSSRVLPDQHFDNPPKFGWQHKTPVLPRTGRSTGEAEERVIFNTQGVPYHDGEFFPPLRVFLRAFASSRLFIPSLSGAARFSLSFNVYWFVTAACLPSSRESAFGFCRQIPDRSTQPVVAHQPALLFGRTVIVWQTCAFRPLSV